MGYTHYWKQSQSFTDKQWRDITAVTRAIIKQSSVKIADGFGEGKPNITDQRICINGLKDESFETFSIAKIGRTDFEFCKTGYRPYDVVVVAILLYISKTYPEIFEVSSDGDIFNSESEDAIPALKLLAKLI